MTAATRAHDLLLAGLVLEDEPGADWAQPAREEQASQLREVRLLLAEAWLGTGVPAEAEAVAAAAVAADPYDERSRRALMRAHAAAGEPARALASYAGLRELPAGWDTSAVPGLDATWQAAGPAQMRCLELAHQSFLAGGLPAGSVIIARDGERVSEGRNRAYDPPGGPDRLQRTPLAHAEMNALASVATEADLRGMTLWSSHRPCLMCAAACEFTGVGAVAFIAPDPSDPSPGPDPDGVETEWVVVASWLFLSGVAAYRGPSSPVIARAAQREPEITALMRAPGDTALRQASLRGALDPAWPAIQAAARARRSRLSGL